MEKDNKTVEKLNIYQKIAKVMQEIEYLAKDDKVVTNQKTGAGYKAISEEKVTSEVRKSLIKNGIVIIPIEQNHKRDDEILKDQYDNEKISRLTTTDTTYRIQNIEDKDDYVLAVSSGTGVDTQDKGIGKAMTYSYKYLLLRTFAIPTGEDTDKISSDVYSEQFIQKAPAKKTSIKKETTTTDLTNYKQMLMDKLLELKIDVPTYCRENKVNGTTTQEEAKKLLEVLNANSNDR